MTQIGRFETPDTIRPVIGRSVSEKNEKPSTAPVRKHKTYEYIKVKKNSKNHVVGSKFLFYGFPRHTAPTINIVSN
jgi:hypothetical protein